MWLVWIQSVSHIVYYRHTGILNWVLLSWWRCQVSAEHGPPLARTPLSRSVLSRWRWLSPGFSWWDDLPVTNWSQSIYLVTEFQLDCDRGDTGERRAGVRCKDECRHRVRDGGERAYVYRLRINITRFTSINFQRTKANIMSCIEVILCLSKPLLTERLNNPLGLKEAMETIPEECYLDL